MKGNKIIFYYKMPKFNKSLRLINYFLIVNNKIYIYLVTKYYILIHTDCQPYVLDEYILDTFPYFCVNAIGVIYSNV